MPLINPGRILAIAASAALIVTAPPLLGAAVAQAYYAPPGDGANIYPPPREEMRPPADPDAVYPPRDAEDVQPPRRQVEEVRPPRDAAEVPAHQVSGMTTPISAVSMRAGPGTDNPVIGTLHHGMPLQLLATANHGWMQVQSPVGTGWVYGSYLAFGTSMPEASGVNASTPMSDGANSQPPMTNAAPMNVSPPAPGMAGAPPANVNPPARRSSAPEISSP